MKIVVLVGGDKLGGTEIATSKIVEYARAASHDIHVLTAGTGNPYWHGMADTPSIIKSIIQAKPNLIHVQAPYLGVAAMLASRRTGIPYLFYERGGVYVLSAATEIIYRMVVRSAKRVVAQTEHQRQALRKYTGELVEVIPNGVDVERFGNMSKRAAREAVGLPLDKKVVLSVGRCRPEKAIGDFVKAAVRADVTYVAVGDGPELRRLRETSGKVKFVGAVPNEQVPVYLCAADVLVNTSKSEGFPMAILEGMASGLPIVAPKVCGIPEIVWDGVHGILTKPGSWQSTADAVDVILDNPGVALEMGMGNRERAKAYSWGNVVRKLYGKDLTP